MLNRILVTGLACLLALAVVGCGGGKSEDTSVTGSENSTEETMKTGNKTVSYGGTNIVVDETWEVKDTDDGKYIYSDYGGMVYLFSQELEMEGSNAEEEYKAVVSGFRENGQYTVSDEAKQVDMGEAVAYRTDIALETDEVHRKGLLELIFTDGRLSGAMFVIPDAAYANHSDDVAAVLDSITLDKPTVPAFSKAEQTDGNKSEGENPDERDATAQDPKYEENESTPVTVGSNEEFAQLLSVHDPGDPIVVEFAGKYAGREIEFDATVANVAPHGSAKTRFDYLLTESDDINAPLGPNFMFEDINFYDFNWEGESPDGVPVGTRLHCVAKVEKYKESSQLFFLQPVKTELR